VGIELYWDNDEQTIMLCEFDSKWTWEELFETLRTVKKVTDRADYEISAIVDVRAGINLPGGSLFNAQNMENVKKMMKMGDEGTGPIVIVSSSPVVRTLYNVAAGINRRAAANILFADSLSQARALLAAGSRAQSAAV
jgi:hypothetical protein